MSLGEEILHSMLEDMKQTLNSIQGSVQSITLVSERTDANSRSLERAFGEIEKTHQAINALSARLNKLEAEQPMTNLVRGWVIQAVIYLVGISATAFITLKVTSAMKL